MSLRKLFLVASLLLWMVGAADAQTLRVTAERTNLRDKPATDGAVVAGVVKGDQLTVVERTGSWYRVRTASGTEGYVSSLLVEVVSAAAPAPAAMTPAVQAPAAPTSPPAAAPAPSPRPAPAQASAPPVQVSSGQGNRPVVIRVMGGTVTGGGSTGFVATAGVGGMRPFGGDNLEVAVEGYLGRISSITVVGGSGLLFYNFATPDLSFKPFVGAGIAMLRVSLGGFSGSTAGLQIAGGVERPLSDRRAIRAETRVGIYDAGSTFMLLAGLSF